MSIKRVANLRLTKTKIKMPNGSLKDVYSCQGYNNVVAIQFDYYYLFVQTGYKVEDPIDIYLTAHAGPHPGTIDISARSIYVYGPHHNILLSGPLGEYLRGVIPPFAKIAKGRLHPYKKDELGDYIDGKTSIHRYTGTDSVNTFANYRFGKFEVSERLIREFIIDLQKSGPGVGVLVVRSRGLGESYLDGAFKTIEKEHGLNVNSWHLSFCRGGATSYDTDENKIGRASVMGYSGVKHGNNALLSESLIQQIDKYEQDKLKKKLFQKGNKLESISEIANMTEDLKSGLTKLLKERVESYEGLEDEHRGGFLFFKGGYTKGEKRTAITALEKALNNEFNYKSFYLQQSKKYLPVLMNGRTGKAISRILAKNNQPDLLAALKKIHS